MISRNRVLTALSHREPDRVPLDLGTTGVTSIASRAYERLKDYLGINTPAAPIIDVVQQLPRLEEVVLEKIGVDTRTLDFPLPEVKMKEEGEYLTYTDAWGIGRRMPREGGLYFDIYRHPLEEASPEDLDKFPWPKVLDEGRIYELAHKAKRKTEKNPYVVISSAHLGGGVFEKALWMRGFERFMMDLVIDLKFAEKLLDKILEIYLSSWSLFLEGVGPYIHIAMIGDDLGTQEAPLISPPLYRRLIKPRQRELFALIKEKAPHVHLFFHSCGSIYDLIPDLIEIGVDILNPIQVSASKMDTRRLKKEFGKDLTFWGGGCDTQKVLPQGTPEEVKEEVKRRIDDLAPGGGFVFTPVHNIQADVPPENIVAMYEAVYEFGKYH